MRRMGTLVRGLGLAFMLVLGCKSTEPELRPKKTDEVLNVPPTTEARFTNPAQYPKDTPKASQLKRSKNDTPLSDPTRLSSGMGTGRPAGSGPSY
jgi:hypothetical protein